MEEENDAAGVYLFGNNCIGCSHEGKYFKAPDDAKNATDKTNLIFQSGSNLNKEN